MRRWLQAVLVGLAASSCGGNAPTDPSALGADCSTLGQNLFVRDVLQQFYLWYRELPDLDPARFPSPEAYLDAVRYRPLDSSFSFISSKAADDAFFSESQFIGFGFRMTLLAPDDLRVTDVFAGSPADEAGLERGARLLEINGRPVEQIVAAGELGSVFGPSQVGVMASLRFRDRGGDEHQATLTKRLVTIPTVAELETYDVGGRTVGYLLFEDFVSPAQAALTNAFGQLRDAGAEELVLDLRYNGGGLLSVTQHLGGLLGGPRTAGQPLVRLVHNDKNRNRDTTLSFPEPQNALGVSRLVVIATRSSASASEVIINGLRPFVPVTVVGDRTFGKPVGQYSFTFCEKVLHPVSFTSRNALDEGDYFDGIPADCAAPDDLGRAFGDPAEASLAEALQFIRTGRCSTTAAAAARAAASRRPADRLQPHRESGWQQLLGAY